MNRSLPFELASVFLSVAVAIVIAAIPALPAAIAWGTAAALAIAALHALLQWALPDIAPTPRLLRLAATRRMAFHANACLVSIALGLQVDACLRAVLQQMLFGTLSEGLATPLGVVDGLLAGGWTGLLLVRIPRLLAASNFDGRVDSSAGERVLNSGAAALLAMLVGTSVLPAPWLAGPDVPSALLAPRPLGLLEAPLVALAAGIGFCLPALLRRSQAAAGPGTWIVVLDADGASTPRRRRIARLLRHRRRQAIGPVNVLIPTATALGGRDLVCASLLRRERRLFPRLAIEADDWVASFPPSMRWPARPQRELHAEPELLLATVRRHVLPQDAVIVVVGNAEDVVACVEALPAIGHVATWAGDASAAPDGAVPIDRLRESGFAWPSSRGASLAAVTPARPGGAASARLMPRIVGWSHEGALSAGALLADFRENSQIAFDRAHQEAATRIAGMLARDAETGATWAGFPGLDHPQRWRTVVGNSFVGKENSVIVDEQRRQDIHIPRWWSAPVVLAQAERVSWYATDLPSRSEVAAMVERHRPRAWSRNRLRLRLDFDVRIYWGARAGDAAGASTFQPCEVCTEQQFSIELDGDVLGQAGIEARRDPIHQPLMPALEAGIGWMVATPILRCERVKSLSSSVASVLKAAGLSASAILRRRIGNEMATLGMQVVDAVGGLLHFAAKDRDPTFSHRLHADDMWWYAALGVESPDREQAKVDAKRGSTMRPASHAAFHKVVPPGGAQVIVIPDALGSVRGSFRDVLNPPSGTVSAAGEPRLIWHGLPVLSACSVWRFEHDTYLGISINVAQLVAAVRQHCAPADGTAGRIVLLGYGRGGVVARFALGALRKALGKQLSFSAVTIGSPHLGTDFVEPVEGASNRLSTRALGLHLGALDAARFAELHAIEGQLALRRPPGWSDLSPKGIARLCRGRPADELPSGMWLVGAHRESRKAIARPGRNLVLPANRSPVATDDGFAPRRSALALSESGNTAADAIRIDVSPLFHTDYLADAASREAIRQALDEAMRA